MLHVTRTIQLYRSARPRLGRVQVQREGYRVDKGKGPGWCTRAGGEGGGGGGGSDALEAALEEVGLEDALLALRRLEHALHVLHQHDAAPLDLTREDEGVEERAAADADRLVLERDEEGVDRAARREVGGVFPQEARRPVARPLLRRPYPELLQQLARRRLRRDAEEELL